MDNDFEEIMQYYDRFKEIVEQISLNAEQQVDKLKGTVVTDEIAIDFSEIGMAYAEKLLEKNWITREQFLLAKSIDEDLETMTINKALWTEDALHDAKEWEVCRKKGKLLLSMLKK